MARVKRLKSARRKERDGIERLRRLLTQKNRCLVWDPVVADNLNQYILCEVTKSGNLKPIDTLLTGVPCKIRTITEEESDEPRGAIFVLQRNLAHFRTVIRDKEIEVFGWDDQALLPAGRNG